MTVYKQMPKKPSQMTRRERIDYELRKAETGKKRRKKKKSASNQGGASVGGGS